MKIHNASRVIIRLKIEVWLFVVGSITIAEDKPICVLIISPPASIAKIISWAMYPIIAPTAKFKSNNNIGETVDGGIPGFKSGVIITVNISAKASFVIVLISFLFKTGANRIKPKSLAKTIKPADKYFVGRLFNFTFVVKHMQK